MSVKGEALRVWKTSRTEKECEEYLDSDDSSDYMGDLTFTIRPIWTNASAESIKKLLK